MGHQYRLTPTCKVIPSLRLCFRSCGGWDERFRGSWDSSGVRGLILDFCCMEKKNQYRGGWFTFLGEKIVFSLEVFLAVFRSGTRFYYRCVPRSCCCLPPKQTLVSLRSILSEELPIGCSRQRLHSLSSLFKCFNLKKFVDKHYVSKIAL